VIGNPPYGISIKGDYRTKVVDHLGKVPDFEIYYYFIECAYKLLGENGIKSYIIPNTFLFNVFASEYRKKLIKIWNIKCLIDCTAFKIFEGATIYNAITVFIKDERNTQKVGYKITKNAESFCDVISRENTYSSKEDFLENNQNWGLVFKLSSLVLRITSKIRKIGVKLDELFPEYSQGLIAYDKYQGQSKEIIESRAYHYTSKERASLKKWLWGEDVTRYSVKWNEKEWIDYCDGIANPRQPKFFKGKRLLLREITNPSIFCAYTEEELCHDPAIIVVLGKSKTELMMLLGLLNSKLASFYHFNSSPKATKGAFPKILVEDIKIFPVKVTSEKLIYSIVSEYLCLVSSSSSLLSFFDRLMDAMVYELYFPEEIKTADAEVLKHLTNLPELKDNWSDEKKLAVIEKVYKELSDPAHPVNIAMKKQQQIPEVRIVEGKDKK